MIKKKVIIFLLLLSSLYSKEITLSIDEAIQLALKNNGLNKISKLNLEIAKAQYKQALSANYPTIDALYYLNRDNKDAIYQQRGKFKLPSDIVGALSLMGITSSTISADIDTVSTGRDTAVGKLEVNYPLYTGGKISAIIEQARLNKHIKKEAVVREANNVVYDVRKYFYGYVLTDQLYSMINESYSQMKISTELTKEFLNTSKDLKIKKTDYLNIKLLTSLTHSALLKIELNKKMLENAIANLIGLDYTDNIKIKYKKDEIMHQNQSLQKLVKDAYKLNPNINSIKLALKIKDEQIKEVEADNYPMVNIFGNVSNTYNSYEYGYLNEDNRNRWSIGVAIKLSLFDGFKTRNKILEKKLDKRVVNEKKELLEKAIAVQLKNEVLKSSLEYQQIKILENAIETAKENSKMNFKGYKYEMVDIKDLIQSKMMEVYVKSDYFKQVHDYLLSLASIDKLVGKEIEKKYY